MTDEPMTAQQTGDGGRTADGQDGQPLSRRRRIRPVPLVALTVVWVLFWGSLSWANVLGGLTLAALIQIVFPLPHLVTQIRVRPLALLWLIGRFLGDLTMASIKVAAQTLRPGPLPRSSVIVVPLTSDSPLVQTLTAEMVTLIPGTLVIELDGETGRMAVHALGADTPERVESARRETVALERRVMRALGDNRIEQQIDKQTGDSEERR